MEQSNVVLLKKLFIQLYNIVAVNKHCDTHYAKRLIPDIIEYIDGIENEERCASPDECKSISTLFQSMFPAKSGLSEFYIWDNDYKARKEANDEYSAVINAIQKLLTDGQ